MPFDMPLVSHLALPLAMPSAMPLVMPLTLPWSKSWPLLLYLLFHHLWLWYLSLPSAINLALPLVIFIVTMKLLWLCVVYNINHWMTQPLRMLFSIQLVMPLIMTLVMPFDGKIITFSTLCQRIICARWGYYSEGHL